MAMAKLSANGEGVLAVHAERARLQARRIAASGEAAAGGQGSPSPIGRLEQSTITSPLTEE